MEARIDAKNLRYGYLGVEQSEAVLDLLANEDMIHPSYHDPLGLAKDLVDGLTIYAEYGSEVVGTGSLVENQIRRLVVREDMRGRGIGTQLLRMLEAELIIQGKNTSEMTVDTSVTRDSTDDTEWMHKWCTRLGFTLTFDALGYKKPLRSDIGPEWSRVPAVTDAIRMLYLRNFENPAGLATFEKPSTMNQALGKIASHQSLPDDLALHPQTYYAAAQEGMVSPDPAPDGKPYEFQYPFSPTISYLKPARFQTNKLYDNEYRQWVSLGTNYPNIILLGYTPESRRYPKSVYFPSTYYGYDYATDKAFLLCEASLRYEELDLNPDLWLWPTLTKEVRTLVYDSWYSELSHDEQNLFAFVNNNIPRLLQHSNN